MANKKIYDEQKYRSREPKPFYKKKLLWVIIILGVIFGAIGLSFLGSKDEAADEPIEKAREDIIRTEETVIEENGNPDSEEEKLEKTSEIYENFEGTYVAFEGEPYNSPVDSLNGDIIVLGNDYYQSFNRWDFDMTSTILDKKIEGNILTLNLDSSENKALGMHSESGTEQFELRYDGDKKVIYSITKDYSLYSMSNKDLQTHYSQSEIDYARIIMTVIGDPSLDQWAIWDTDNEIPVIKVSHNSAGDPTEASKDVFYPEDITHLNLTSQGMAAGVITYTVNDDGYITKYPMPLHYHQEDQSEEGYQKLAQEALDKASMLYVEPFDPYTVADFIGHVNFVYE